jgi:hypothetical protein
LLHIQGSKWLLTRLYFNLRQTWAKLGHGWPYLFLFFFVLEIKIKHPSEIFPELFHQGIRFGFPINVLFGDICIIVYIVGLVANTYSTKHIRFFFFYGKLIHGGTCSDPNSNSQSNHWVVTTRTWIYSLINHWVVTTRTWIYSLIWCEPRMKAGPALCKSIKARGIGPQT